MWLTAYLKRIRLHLTLLMSTLSQCICCKIAIVLLHLYLRPVSLWSRRSSWWSTWMWRTAAVPRSHQPNSHTPAPAVSLLHFSPRRNHRGRSNRSSSKDQFQLFCKFVGFFLLLPFLLSCPLPVGKPLAFCAGLSRPPTLLVWAPTWESRGESCTAKVESCKVRRLLVLSLTAGWGGLKDGDNGLKVEHKENKEEKNWPEIVGSEGL